MGRLGVLPGTERGRAWQEPGRLKLPGHWIPRAVVVAMLKQYKRQGGGGRGTTAEFPSLVTSLLKPEGLLKGAREQGVCPILWPELNNACYTNRGIHTSEGREAQAVLIFIKPAARHSRTS